MKFGICNEIFQEWNDMGRTIDYVKETGYDGLEIAPFTLSQYVTDVPARTRSEVAKRAEEADLDILGIHWILSKTEGLHLTHPDKDMRDRTAQYLIDLAHFCGDVTGKVAIFGSPQQRNLVEGLTYEEAEDNAVSVFEKAMPAFEDRGVTICMEQLSPNETNFCQTAEQTVHLIERVGHPNFQLLLDTKAMAQEPLSRGETIRKYGDYLRHYHANDENLEGPGFGDVDFGPIFEALADIGYDRYVSVEVFKFDPGPEAIAEKSLSYLRQFV